MTFEELNDLIVAVRASRISFDYFERIFKITVIPEYGYDESVTNKKFLIEIQDCIYFCCANTSITAGGSNTEFIFWGKHLEKDCNDGCNSLTESFLSKTPSAAMGKDFEMRRKLDKEYYHFFFQNALGDAIDVLASKDSVKEVEL